MEKLQAVRGTKDLFGEDFAKFEFIIEVARKVAEKYGYQSVSLPIFEFANVFKRVLGETSDVVGKEMYSFLDKGGEEITLRPEFTAGICRAFISNGWKQLLPLKLFTFGPLFRYERPQKGRQRQFHQLNYEFLGPQNPEIDAEIIAMAANLLEVFGVLDNCSLELNSLGCSESRKKYQVALVEYLKDFASDLSNDSKLRLERNPLRVLDSKDENDKKIVINAPKISDYFTQEASDFFAKLQEYLTLLGVKFNVNSKLVRGLDYYNHTAFEFITNDLGAQGTVLGGGRYNGLIKMLGGDDVAGIGFAAGIERLALLTNLEKKPKRSVAVLNLIENNCDMAMKIANMLRKNNITVMIDYNVKFDKALKNALKANSSHAIFIGEEELRKDSVKLKDLDKRSEEIVKISEILERL